ncbi:unnamed protein product [Caenorhabditis angaria]|uniref:Uncharacterized protein n=1 Tax=Caenorhabditis angaria TaxID=860376 RepID=A0A9P1IK59_9PELO|nr:unnamed protein product [Caenorhabditis angaria]
MFLLLFILNSINILHSENNFFNKKQLLKSYTDLIQNQDSLLRIVHESFAVYNCSGHRISGYDFNVGKLDKLMDTADKIPIRPLIKIP